MVSSFKNNPEAIECLADSNLELLNSERDLVLDNQIFVIDENNPLLYRGDCAKLFNESNNYFVIMTRTRKFNNLKVGLDSLVEMVCDDNGLHTIRACYPRKENLGSLGECIVSEDSSSGKEFLEEVLGCKVESSFSKEKIGVTLKKLKKSSYTIVYNRSGISFSYEDQMNYINRLNIDVVSEIDWDSFESYILESPEYGIEVPWYPDKEKNAEKLFKQVIDKDYNKSKLPQSMLRPLYWKVKEALEIINSVGDMNLF